MERPFKRILVTDNHLTRLIRYIHQNPEKHGYSDDFRCWEWSSYSELLNEAPRVVTSGFAVEWFQNKEEFIDFHRTIETESRLE